MLCLKELSFCNIGRFVEMQTIDFTNKDRLIQVNGMNKNTGGSSGAAKSTVFHALDYLLGINEIPATALQSRLTKDSISVKGVFEVNDKELIIKRSKKEGLSVKYGDDTVTGNVKLAEEKIDEVVGIPRKLFKKMVHKKQKEGGFFLNLTAKDSYNFLMKVLGLEGFVNKTDLIDQDMKKLISEVENLNGQIETTQALIDEYNEMLAGLDKPCCSITIEMLDELVEKEKKAKQNVKELKEKREENLKDIIKPEPINADISTEAIEKFEQELLFLEKKSFDLKADFAIKKNQAEQIRDDFKYKINRIPEIKASAHREAKQIKDLIGEKEHIKSQKCPTCLQKWIGNSAEDKIKNITLTIDNKKQKILELKPAIEEEGVLIKKLAYIEKAIKDAEESNPYKKIDDLISEKKHDLLMAKANNQSKITELENEHLKKMAEYNSSISKIKEGWDEKIKQAEYDCFNIFAEYKEKNGELNLYKIELENYEKNTKDLKNRIKERKKQKKELEKERDGKHAKAEVASEAKRLIKTYTLQIFQNTLDYIGNYATDILSNIPNMSNCTIYFEGCKENKNGNIKDEVSAIINMDGYNNINIKTLSGGERTAIDLAVDLAVIDMIESKAGKGANFFILDEPFDGLEDINISQCLEVIKTVDTNKKIIIVDHNPIAKEMITDSIIVVRNGETSEVMV